jgi:hypothetical protein
MIGNSDYERVPLDFYPTPKDATNALFGSGALYYCKDEIVWEPACGNGAMSNVLKNRFKSVINSDINPQMDDALKADFYSYEPEQHFDWIVTNPPYGKEINKFMDRILFWLSKGKNAAILARNELDSASGRMKYFGNCRYFTEKRVLTWRPKWIADSTGSPRHNYAWFIWIADNAANPSLSYSTKSRS